MRLRLAIKIIRYIEEPWRYNYRSPRYNRGQINEAWKLCQKKWMDNRVPYMPRDWELEMRGEIFDQLLLGGPMFGEGIFEGIVPEEELDKVRKELGREPFDGVVDPILAGVLSSEDPPEDSEV